MASYIRWKKGDYIRLGQAVSRFNKMLSELDDVANDVLPKGREYKELRDTITTRAELNRIIKSLGKATKENLREVHTFSSGEEITSWEFNELKKAKRRAIRHLKGERTAILDERPSIGMGDERLSEIKAIEESFEKLDEKTGKGLDTLKERIFTIGRSDYGMYKDKIFMENFYTALEGLQNFDHYEDLKKELGKIKNPHKFYEYVKQSPTLMDIFLYYKGIDTNIYGAFSSNEEAFDSALFYHLGIDINI